MKNTILDNLFRELSGYTCSIKSGGLYVHGSIEVETKLQYQQYYGLLLYSPLKWNTTKVTDILLPTLNSYVRGLNVRELNKEVKENLTISFDTRDKIFEELKESLDNTWVQIGTLSCNSVLSFKPEFSKEGVLYSLEITYEDSVVKMYGFKKK